MKSIKDIAKQILAPESKLRPPESQDVALRPAGVISSWNHGRKLDGATALAEKEVRFLNQLDQVWIAFRNLDETRYSYWETRRKLDRAEMVFDRQDNEAKLALINSQENVKDAEHNATLRDAERKRQLKQAGISSERPTIELDIPREETQEEKELQKDIGMTRMAERARRETEDEIQKDIKNRGGVVSEEMKARYQALRDRVEEHIKESGYA